MLLVASACTTLAAPSTTGVRLYQQGDADEAYAELAPLADRGDAAAQFYAAYILLQRKALASASERERALSWLLGSATSGNLQAYGLILALATSADEEAAFVRASASSESLVIGALDETPALDESSLRAPNEIGGQAYAIAEEVAGGPLDYEEYVHMAKFIYEIAEGKIARPAISISDEQLFAIDEARAKAGGAYAQARLGKRYALGRGVAKNDALAFDWRLKAAKTRGPGRSCVYQAPAGGGSGSTYCYDTSPATAGVPEAILEVCRAYAYGIGTDRNPGKAQGWCKRASQNSSTRESAQRVLRDLGLDPR